MPEQLALAEQVEHAFLRPQLDRALTDHPQVRDRAIAGAKDGGPGGQ